jgi:hypothetical protein
VCKIVGTDEINNLPTVLATEGYSTIHRWVCTYMHVTTLSPDNNKTLHVIFFMSAMQIT